MKKKNVLFAALTLAALSAGLVSCDDAQNLKDQQKFNVTVVSLDDAMGTVTGSGQYPAGSEIVITATANEGYSFQKWHDGNTDNPRTITVTADVTYTAIFTANNNPQQKFNVTVVSLDDAMGTVTGSGQYPAGSEIVITATANEGYSFQKWHDGNTDNPRTITVTADATYTAIFASSYDPGQYFYVTVVANDEARGTVKGEGNYPAGAKINIMATPNRGFVFQQWNDGNTDTVRTVTVTADATYTAIFDYCISGTANGHDYVDLGLPSGLKWATCNVGATTPDKYGEFYQWGEIIEVYGSYYWSYYQWATGRTEGWSDIFETLTKYNTVADFGTVDNKTVLELADDAARANWGGQWRMPTDAEWTELRENCEWTWVVDCYQSKTGCIVKGPNGNFIFLPAAGYGWDHIDDKEGVGGYYWSSSLNTASPVSAWGVNFSSDDVRRSDNQRCNGLSVRAVCK